MDKLQSNEQILKAMLKEELKIATTTFSSKENAVEYSRVLIDKNLVACAQIQGPILSIYKWKKKINHCNEWRVVIKFVESNEKEIVNVTLRLHEYDLPQWASWRAQTTEGYCKWINGED